MHAARTIRRVASAIGCAALLGACHADGKPPKRRPPGAPSAFASAMAADGADERPKPAPSAAPKPSAIVQTLSALRAHRLPIAAPTVQSELLAFGAHRLVQASLDKATFRDSKDGQVVTEASIGTVRAVAHG